MLVITAVAADRELDRLGRENTQLTSRVNALSRSVSRLYDSRDNLAREAGFRADWDWPYRHIDTERGETVRMVMSPPTGPPPTQ